MIKEVIIVEGKDDIAAVKAAVDAQVIATHGFGYGMKLIRTLQDINERRGIIIFTDPDYMGNKIRKDLSSHLKGAKHAFLPQGKAKKKDNIGVENACVEDIKLAIEKARPKVEEEIEKTFSQKDLIINGLSGAINSNKKREKLCEILGIGYGNSKQLLSRLNSFKISRQEFEKAMEEVNNG